MAFNLIRNARVFFTTNVSAATGVVASSGFTSTNTFEIQVMDGLSFTQNTTTETITLNEAGSTPNRGQRNFNTVLEPVDFSFSTYIRPKDFDPDGAGAANSHQVTCEERHLWNAMFGYTPLAAAGATTTATRTTGQAWGDSINDGSPSATAYAEAILTASNKNQLLQFGMLICLDDTTFIIDNCVMDTATIDFGLDTIAMVQWAGKASAIRQLAVTTWGTPSSGVTTATGALTGNALFKDTTAPYLANKLSTVELKTGISSAFTAGTIDGIGSAKTYTIALTGGSVTIANNVTYLTPANLGVVNKPITYFTGSRTISGTINAYLRTGGNSTAQLLTDLLAASETNVNPAFNLKMSIGGSTATTKVDLEMPAAMLQIPTIASEQVISTTVGFTAQGYSGSAFDIGSDNELAIKYYAANT
jgi:hypothetical protein